MSLDALIVLVLLGALLVALKWRRTGWGFLAAAALLFVVEGCGWLPAWLLQGLQAPYAERPTIAWAPRNVIVLLGAGTVRIPGGAVEPELFANARINEALAIWRQCKASGNDCKLEVSGGDALRTGKPEATVYAGVLEALGVPAGDLLLEPRSMNTWQNAQFSAPVIQAYGAERVVLVSSATHLRRASLYFRHFGIDATPVRADWLTVRKGGWPRSWSFAVTDLALHEYAGVVRYHVYERMGWNPAASRPGAP